ncbi:hypothetical protein PSHT_04065, partial [Puccinia striiformis]
SSYSPGESWTNRDPAILRARLSRAITCDAVLMYKKAGFNSRPCILHHQQSDIAAIRLTTQQKDPTFTILHHSFRMRFAVATAVSLTVLGSVSALFPLPSGLGQSGCSNQNGALNLELLTNTNCYSNGGSTPMSCGNQGGDPSGSGILGGLLGSGALINVNALNTRLIRSLHPLVRIIRISQHVFLNAWS